MQPECLYIYTFWHQLNLNTQCHDIHNIKTENLQSAYEIISIMIIIKGKSLNYLQTDWIMVVYFDNRQQNQKQTTTNSLAK